MSDPTPAIPTSTTDYYRPMPVFVPRPPRQKYWLHALLLLLTFFTTTVVGSHMQDNFQNGWSVFANERDSLLAFFPIDLIAKQPSRLLLGLPFSLSLMLILLAHEMGHYLACVHYGVSATLPYFIPFPSLIGTMGAFIRIRSPIRSRAALFDIGIAGPIAGFVVATIVLFISLPLSHPATSGPAPEVVLSYPLIFKIAHWLVAVTGIAPETAAAPLDALYLHPVTIAAWFGMFATALNLLPGGQLDGGHIVYSIAPRAHRIISRITLLCLVPLGVYYFYIWLLWAVFLELTMIRQPQVADLPRVSGSRRGLAILAALMLALTFTRAPFLSFSLKEMASPLVSWFHDRSHSQADQH